MPKWKSVRVKNPVTGKEEHGWLPVDKYAKEEIKKNYADLGYKPIGSNAPETVAVGIDVRQKV